MGQGVGHEGPGRLGHGPGVWQGEWQGECASGVSRETLNFYLYPNFTISLFYSYYFVVCCFLHCISV